MAPDLNGAEAGQARALVTVFDEGDAEGIRTLSVQYDLEVLPFPIQETLQEILDCVRLASQAGQEVGEAAVTGDGAWFHLNPATNRRLEGEELAIRTRAWIMRAAFRDAMETAHAALESARLVLAVQSLSKSVSGHEFNQAVHDEAEKFHTLPLGRKLETLAERYDFHIDAFWQGTLTRLNAARNCIVHRAGYVSPRDTQGAEYLEAAWQGLRLVVGKPPTQRTLVAGDVIQGGEVLRVQRGPVQRHYPLGSRIELDMQDLNEICMTLELFAQHLRQNLATLSTKQS